LGVASAVAEEPFPVSQDHFNWKLEGLLALYDPPKKNIAEVIRQLYATKVNVKLVTGDYAPTALTIARQVGIRTSFPYQTGEEVMRMNDEELRISSANTSIYARMFPEAKLRLVKSLRASGHTVAMTGDGVNDAPALKAADIGIAMGNRGTEMAQQAADLVIADDDLAKINLAVTEGRKIYQNLRKAVRYIITIHTPIILIATLPLILGWTFPNIFTPIHIIFLELIMGPTCSIFFEKEPVADIDLSEGPRKRNSPLLMTGELLTSVIQGAVIAAGILLLYYWFMQSGKSLEETRTMVFTSLLLANIFLTFSVRSYSETIIKTLRYKNRLALPIVLISASFLALILLFPPARQLFGLSTLSAGRFGLCVVIALVSVGWFEVYKANLPVGNDPTGVILLLFPSTDFIVYTTLQQLMPFQNPSLAGTALLLTISSSSLIAFYGLIAKARNKYRWSTICGMLLVVVALLQVLLLQTAQWEQVAMAGMGTLIILIAYQLKGRWAV
ncbi:MAG: cation-translocating P-type ATPase, partial [Sphingobacteriales bacterium]